MDIIHYAPWLLLYLIGLLLTIVKVFLQIISVALM